MTTRPAVTAPGPWSQPWAVESELPNGIRVLLHDIPGQQVIAVRTVLPLSLADESPDHEGVSAMMARLLDEGAGDRGPEEFALALERHGAGLGAGVMDGGLSVDLDVPRRHLRAALGLLTDAITVPTFPQEEVRRILRNRVAEYEHESSSAPHRAARELIATLWASGDRASRPTAGSPDTIGRLDRAIIRARHAALGPAGAAVVVAGDLRDIDPHRLLTQTLGQWSYAAPAPSPLRPPTPAPGGTRIVLVDRPGSVQSEFAIGAPAIGRSDPNWPAYPVLAYVLGGSPGARIDALLREDKGYTYGIRAAMRPRVAGGSFLVSGSVRSDVTAEALELLMGVIEGARRGFGTDEIRAGIDFITRATPGRWATAGQVADETAALALEGLPLDFPQRTVRAMEGIEVPDVDAAMARLSASGWVIVIVADAESVADTVRATGIGPVTIVPS